MKSGLPIEAVGSSVNRSCPLYMLTHYNICPWAAHGQLSGQELSTNFQSHYNKSDHGLPMDSSDCFYIVRSSVVSSNLNASKVVGSGQLQHSYVFIMPVNNYSPPFERRDLVCDLNAKIPFAYSKRKAYIRLLRASRCH